MKNLYSGTLVDMQKMKDYAYKTAHDKFYPSDVTVHHHLHGEPCNIYQHEYYKASREEVEDV